MQHQTISSPFYSAVVAIRCAGGLYDHGYDRNRFAKRFNAQTIELNGSLRPKVLRRKVNSLPFMIGA